MEKPALSAVVRNISWCFEPRTHQATTAYLPAAANVSERRNWTKNLVVSSGCSGICPLLPNQPPPLSRGHMASAHKNSRARTHQKSHALRMLLTSGVVRSADVDPPSMGIPRSQASLPSRLPSRNVIHTRLVHTTQHKRQYGLFAQWQNTFADILKEFGKR